MPILAGFMAPHPPVIVPAVGGGREKEIGQTVDSYREIMQEIARLRPETVVVISPHSTVYGDYIHISPGKKAWGDLSDFGAMDRIEADYDRELVKALAALCESEHFPAGCLGEKNARLDHGTYIPLHFLQAAYTQYKLVRVAPSGLSREQHYAFGVLLQAAVNRLGRRVVVIASGDLSHKLKDSGPYGFATEGPALDRLLTGCMASGDFGELFDIPEQLCRRGAECGMLPFLMLAGALDGMAVEPKLLSYEGPFGVGYAVASFTVTGDDPQREFLSKREKEFTLQPKEGEDPYVSLARMTLESYVQSGRMPPLPENLPEELTGTRAGVFVSIKKRGELRGCIGTTEPTKDCIAQEIRFNAISSGTRDPRFAPVGSHELLDLCYSVDVLGQPEPADRSMLDPACYGVIVTSGFKRGLLLPNLDGVDTVEQQIAIAKQKAGIGPGESCTMERFEVVRHM